MIILIMNTGRYEHDLDSILIFGCANKNIIANIHTNGDFMIGWFIGQLIFWVGLITIIMWSLSKCAVL
jgi:hypothetical protein